MNLLEINDLEVRFKTKRGIIKAVNGISCSLKSGETLGIVGESGCGKSALAMSILRLLDSNGYISCGNILFNSTDLSKLSHDKLCQIRGNEISVIFQEPMTSLNPVFTIERQIGEVFKVHEHANKRESNRNAVEMLKSVNIPNAENIAKQFPHQLSGGMRQRVMIAMALACKPQILIADEPTTALDVTIQAQILNLMNDLKNGMGTSIIFITHDLGVIKQMADTVAVMYCGQIVESAPVKLIFGGDDYLHPYTEALLNSVPQLYTETVRLEAIAGTVPNPLNLPKGCKFAGRCKYSQLKCGFNEPELADVSEKHKVRCHFPLKGVRNNDK